jgi:hypothetical protein
MTAIRQTKLRLMFQKANDLKAINAPNENAHVVAGIVLTSALFALLALSIPLNLLIRLQAIIPKNIASAVPRPIATVRARMVGTFHRAGSLTFAARWAVPLRCIRQAGCGWTRILVLVGVGSLVVSDVLFGVVSGTNVIRGVSGWMKGLSSSMVLVVLCCFCSRV